MSSTSTRTSSSTTRHDTDTTPIGLTVRATETVEVVDPTHPLYGLKLPLLGITIKQGPLGRVCRVWLHPGVERAIPVAATDRGDVLRPPSRSRLTAASITTLLALVASLPDDVEEDAHAPGPAAPASPHRATTRAAAGDGGRTTPAHRTHPRTSTGVAQSWPDAPGDGTPGGGAGVPGGGS